MKKLFTKCERTYILRHAREQGKKQLLRDYEVIIKMVNRMPKVKVRKEMHLIEYKDDIDFAIDPESKRRKSFGSKMKIEWEMNEYTKYTLKDFQKSTSVW
jgi:hypothetical protein